MNRNVMIFGGIMVGMMYLSYLANQYLERRPEPIIQQHVIGREKPDIFIEKNGVKYFSHVDGREISDLVKE